MSERGSFVTEYIYCERCLDAIKPILLRDSKGLRGTMMPSWTEAETPFLPIIAGKIGESYPGGEMHAFEYGLLPRIASVICHPVRIAVLADNGDSAVFTAEPPE